jgi:hypothetical protein
MSRDFRKPHNRFSQHVQWFTFATLGFLMRLVVFSAVFVHQVSPLRDSSFKPTHYNAGSLLPWMQGINEDTWTQGASVLAGLLATNLVFIFWQWSQSSTNVIQKILLLTCWIGVGIIIFTSLYLLFFFYLLGQWIID